LRRPKYSELGYRQWVSGELFSVLGLKPVMGRLLTEDDDRVVGKSPYAVISYDYWQRRFERDPKVVGRTFRMGDNVYEIVGVAPKGFYGNRARNDYGYLCSGEDGPICAKA